MSPRLTLVVARAKNGVIGRNGDLPWRLKSDLARFKVATLGKPVIMGRKTWDSLPRKPLPGRANIVVSRDKDFRPEGAWSFSDLEAALAAGRAMAAQSGAEEVCAIGGAEIFRLLIERADRILLTEVDVEPAGDAHFPDLDSAHWIETSRETVEPGPQDDAGFVIRRLERRT